MDFVIVANAWDDRLNNPTSKHHVAIELLRRGHRVLWIAATGMRSPRIWSMHDWRRATRKISSALSGIRRPSVSSGGGELHVLSPFVLPFPRFGLMCRLNNAIYSRCALAASQRLSFENPALITFLPIVPRMLASWPGTSVYYCVDRWDAFDMYDSRTMTSLDRESCQSADCIAASSTDLLERCIRHNKNVELIRHGVNYSHFSRSVEAASASFSRPADLPDGPIVGFIGLLSAWIDHDLIVSVARRVAPSHVVLIGNADVSMDKLAKEPNIHMMGPRSYKELPVYMAYFSVGIIPFKVNELTRAVNPLKLREMMAAGCPVVSTALPEAERYSDDETVFIGRDADEFAGHVCRLMENPVGLEKRKMISDRMADETWEGKVAELLNLIEDTRR